MSATMLDGVWDLSPADRLIIEAKCWGGRLRFAVMLLFCRARGRFPRDAAEVDKDAVADLAHKLGVPAPGSQAALLPASDARTLHARSPQPDHTGCEPSRRLCNGSLQLKVDKTPGIRWSHAGSMSE